MGTLILQRDLVPLIGNLCNVQHLLSRYQKIINKPNEQKPILTGTSPISYEDFNIVFISFLMNFSNHLFFSRQYAFFLTYRIRDFFRNPKVMKKIKKIRIPYGLWLGLEF